MWCLICGKSIKYSMYYRYYTGREIKLISYFYSYTKALTNSGVIWNETTLNDFLKSPVSETNYTTEYEYDNEYEYDDSKRNVTLHFKEDGTYDSEYTDEDEDEDEESEEVEGQEDGLELEDVGSELSEDEYDSSSEDEQE